MQELISDAHRFAQTFSKVIQQHPLQVYAGALPFTPVDTLLYRTFHDINRDPWIVTLKDREKSWSPLLVTLREIRRCRCIKFSPDGTQVMASAQNGVFLIHDVTTGATLNTPIQAVFSRSCAFSPDGTWVCSVHQEGSLRVWDPMSGSSVVEPIRIPGPVSGRYGAPCSVLVSPDGALIACSCGPTIYVWRAISGTKIFESIPRSARNMISMISCLTFSPDSKLVVSGSENGEISWWDLDSGREVLATGRIRGCTARILSVHATADGSQIISVGKDWFIRIWDAMLGTCIVATSLQTRSGVARSATFSVDGQQIVLCTDDGKIGLWGSPSGVQVRIITTNMASVDVVALSPNGRFIASADTDSVSLWDATMPANTTVNLSRRKWHAQRIVFSYSSDGTLVALTVVDDESTKPIILILDGKSGEEKDEPLRGHEGSEIESIVFSPDALRIASGSDDGIRVWDTTSRTQVFAIAHHHGNSIQALAFSSDGRQIVSGSRRGGAICVWEAGSGTAIIAPLHQYQYRTESVECVSFSPDGGQIMSVSTHGHVHLWDTISGAMLLGPLRGGGRGQMFCPRVAFSPDGTRIFLRTRDGRLKQWDAITGTAITTQRTNICTWAVIDRPVFNQHAMWISDLTTGFALSYPPVAISVRVPPTSSQTSLAFATLTNFYIINFPPWMLSAESQ